MSLKEYNRKRDFKKTAEPAGELEKQSANRFVIQKHAASHLHYDFRLEMGGTLRSWAVPKGVPYTKGEKRLAVQVEDHPVSYIHFEGTIPKGQYGGGTVMVWDAGTYEPLTATPGNDLAGGKLHFILRGKKLQGEWYLVRLKDGKNWLLFKGAANLKPVSAKLDDRSAISGRTMAEISHGNKVWHSNRAEAASAKVPIPRKKVSFPAFIEPMKAKLAGGPKPGNWLYEIKFDGFRALAYKKGNAAQLLSRNNKAFDEKFPEIVEAVASLSIEDAILDGEIVALDEKGRSSFQLLQAFDLNQGKPPIIYYVFDVLRFKGKDLRHLPLTDRKQILKKALQKAPDLIRESASLAGDVQELLKEAQKLGLEGLIGKQPESHYEAGERTGAWIKLKLHQEQELVIGGYTDPEGSRHHFGSLILGYYQKGSFLCAGKVGTGFNEALLRSISKKFASIGTKDCLFRNLPEKKTGRYGAGITVAEMKRCHWLKPVLVCQVKYSEWTRDGKLRHPVFLGLREDKSAKEVVREKAS